MHQPTPSPLRHREPAQVLVIFALSAMALAAILGLVLDGGHMYVQRRTAQSAADAGALAGTLALRNATPATSPSTIGQEVCTFVQANAFGAVPSPTRAYFVGTDGVTNVGNVPLPCTGATGAATIPTSASGVTVESNVTFNPFLAGMLGFSSFNAAGAATAQVGVLTGFDARNAPIIACGGVSGSALWIPTITPQIATTTPRVLAATPTGLPSFDPAYNDDPSKSDIARDRLLVTPGPGTPTPPAYRMDESRDGRTYYLKGQHIDDNKIDGNCGASGFKGAAMTQQPTPYVKDLTDGVDDIMWGLMGNDVPKISERIASAGACPGGTDLDNFNSGQPGCVMVLPVAFDEGGGSVAQGKPLKIGAFAAFYVWCMRNSGPSCQVVAGQYLADWEIAGGAAANQWTYGQPGGMTVIRLTD